MKRIVLFCSLILVTIFLPATVFATSDWTKLLGATGEFTYGLGITHDSNNNAYVTGYTTSFTPGDFDGQPLVGAENLFLTKYDSSGIKQWTRVAGVTGGHSVRGNGVTTDSSNNIYVVGHTGNTIDQQPVSGHLNLLIMKYSPDGVRQWTRLLGVMSGNASMSGSGITCDSDGNIYATGYTEGNLDGNTITGLKDMFVTKYDSAGNRQWTRVLGSLDASIYGNGITSDSNNNVYVVGLTDKSLDGQTLQGVKDLFVTKYDSAGVKQWTKLLGVAGATTSATSIAHDSNNNIYVTGDTNGNLDNQSLTGVKDMFLTKYDSSGVKQWTKLIAIPSGYTLPNTLSTYGFGITLDLNDNIYVTGHSQGQFTTGLYGSNASFVTQYDANGTNKGHLFIGSAWLNTYAKGVTVGSDNKIYVAGSTDGDLNDEIRTGVTDLFVTKLDYSIDSITQQCVDSIISFFPNPFCRETRTVISNDEVCKDGVDVVVYDSIGKRVFEKKVSGSASKNNPIDVVLDFGEVKDGIYFINISSGQRTFRSAKVAKTGAVCK